MNLLTKTYTLALLLVCLSQNIHAAKIAIIESTSFNEYQVMDENWQAAAINMGHQATIYDQATLDDINNLDTYDVLVISSGLIGLPANRQATIQAFVESGRSIYIQSEYLETHPGNTTFKSIIENFGNAFTWEGQESNSIVPMEVSGSLSNTPNTILPLSYFWYGTYGSGDASVIPFLQNNNKNYGFLYCPEDMTLGKIITTTDQDWIRVNLSPELLENILYNLVNTTIINQLPLVTIDLTNEPDCAGDPFTFTATIENNIAGIILQWTVNGQPVTGENGMTFSSTTLEDGDVVECVLSMPINCGDYEYVSNPILIATIIPLTNPLITIDADATSICQNQEVVFTATISDMDNVTNYTLKWMLNGNPINGATEATYSSNTLNNNDQITCEMIYDNDCNQGLSAFANELTIGVTPALLPNISINATTTEICEGELVSFSAAGVYWGTDPIIQWQIDGVNVGDNNPIFETTSLINGQQVSCFLTSSEGCLLANDIESNQINMTVNPTLTPSITIEADVNEICQGETINFTAQGENWGSMPFFQWMLDGITVGNNEPVFSTSILNPNQTLTCIVTSSEGCLSYSLVESNPINVMVNIPAVPVINISADYSQICEGTEVTFTAEGTNFGSNPSFQWMIDGTNVGTNNPTFSTSNLTTGQQVTCNLISDADCISTNTASSNSLSITIATLNLDIVQSINDLCEQGTGGATVNLYGGVSPITFSWSNGMSGNQIDNLNAGTYTVTATDAIGCSTSIEINVESADGLAVENIITERADCSGDDGSAQIVMSDPTTTYFFTWTNSAGEVVSLSHHAYDLTPGVYDVEITNEYDCYTTETVVIESSAPVILELDETVRIDFGDTYTLSPIVSSAGNLTYSWSPAEGLSCTDCLNPRVTPGADAKYTLTVTNDAGCSATASIIIYLNLNHDVYIPNAFSPNGDGNNDYFTAYADHNLRHIKTLKVVDRWGNVLFDKSEFQANVETAGWNGTFKGNKVAAGVYLYQMEVEFANGAKEILSGDVTVVH